MRYSFIAYGHNNITSKHKSTLEITRETNLTKKGDCIIGVKANFELRNLKYFIKNTPTDTIEILLKVDNITEKIKGKINREFRDNNSIVIRKSNFISNRTLVTNANKSAKDLPTSMIDSLKNPLKIVNIIFRDSPLP